MTPPPDIRAFLAGNPSEIELRVAEWLRAARPGVAVVCSASYSFDLDVFAREGQCALERDEALTVRRWWQNEADVIEPTTVQGLAQVKWKDHRLEVLTLSWNFDGCSRDEVHWVLAADLVVARAFVEAVECWNDRVVGGLLVFEHGTWRRTREMSKSIEAADFDQLVLPASLKDDLRRDVSRFFANRAFYDTHDVAWRRGLLLVGPPGNGKTHTVRALLKDAGVNAVYVRSFRGRNDSDEHNMATVFHRARRIAPCILVLEDLDCLVTDVTRSMLLNELDGFASNRGILVLATTNHPDKLDRSLLDRPSRFDRKFHFPVPEAAERRAYLELFCNRLHADLRPSPAALADAVERTGGFTYAYLKELVVSTATRWVGEASPPPVDALLDEQLRALRDDMKSVIASHGVPLDGPRRIGVA